MARHLLPTEGALEDMTIERKELVLKHWLVMSELATQADLNLGNIVGGTFAHGALDV